MRRYSDSEEAEELKRQVIEYVRTQIHDVDAEIEQFKTASATAESASQAEGQQFEDVSSSDRLPQQNSQFDSQFCHQMMSNSPCYVSLCRVDGITRGRYARNEKETEDG